MLTRSGLSVSEDVPSTGGVPLWATLLEEDLAEEGGCSTKE